jgi:hypothetical protein
MADEHSVAYLNVRVLFTHIFNNRFPLLVRKLCKMIVVRVPDHDTNICLSEAHSLDILIVKFPSDILHGADAAFFRLFLIEFGFDLFLANNKKYRVIGKSHKGIENGPNSLLVGDLDKQCSGKLVMTRKNSVVRIDLMLNMLVVNESLSPHHLMNLEEHGRSILEEERHERTDRNTTMPFFFDYTPANFRAGFFIFGDIFEVGEFDGFHIIVYYFPGLSCHIILSFPRKWESRFSSDTTLWSAKESGFPLLRE